MGYPIITCEQKVLPHSSPHLWRAHTKAEAGGLSDPCSLLFLVVPTQHPSNEVTLLALCHVLWFEARRINHSTDKASCCEAFLLKTQLKTEIRPFCCCSVCSVGVFVLMAGQDVFEGPRPPWNSCHVLVVSALAWVQINA